MNTTTRRLAAAGCLIVLIGLGLVIGSCGQEEQAEGKLNVVASIFPMYDMARAVGGADIALSQLIPPGAEAHTFEPTPGDIIRLEKADVVVYNGADMEPWIGDILSGVKTPDLLVVNTSDGIVLIREKNEGNSIDPHIWLDVDNAKKQVDAIAAAFEKKDGLNASAYRGRAEEYKRRLDEVDGLYREALADCQSNVIVSSGHFAFGYLAARYGLDYTAVYGLAPDAEPTPARISEIIDMVKAEKTRYLFAEEMLDPRLTESIREETGAEILYVSSGHEVSKDDFNRGITLIDIMKKNLESFKRGLSCR